MSDSSFENSDKAVYCFDFDGVLCDSMDESLITSYSAYFGAEAKSVSQIDPALRDFFYRHRFLVRPAEEYHVLYHAFENGETVFGKDRFLQLKAAVLQSDMKEHARRFYAYRKALREDMDSWLGLHNFYRECTDFLENRENRFFIVSNKDRDSIVLLARRHGYLDRIIDIYSREIAIDKKILLEKLIVDKGLDPQAQRIIFVDDHEGTLNELKELPLDLYQAAWGYTNADLESGSFKLIRSLDELP